MPSNDKVSLMTAAVAADVGGSAGRIEMVKAFATLPVTLGLDFATLRTAMFAGSTGFTATDPLVVGAITSTGLLKTTLTTQQLALHYDASNHLAVTVANNGAVTYNATGVAAGHIFSNDLTVGNSKFVVTAATGAVASNATVTAGAGTVITAGGSLLGLQVSSTANFGVFVGSGAPTISAAKGSLYLRSDGSATNNRAYIATDGAGTWTALTTAA